MKSSFEKHIKNDRYQVFLMTCPATLPFSHAAHPYFAVNDTKELSRFHVRWQKADPKNRSASGHVYKDGPPLDRGIEILPLVPMYWRGEMKGVIEGEKGSVAEKMISVLNDSLASYPERDRYSLLGPNSNTYAQWVLDQFPGCGLQLPKNAFGKSWYSVKK